MHTEEEKNQILHFPEEELKGYELEDYIGIDYRKRDPVTSKQEGEGGRILKWAAVAVLSSQLQNRYLQRNSFEKKITHSNSANKGKLNWWIQNIELSNGKSPIKQKPRPRNIFG